MRPSSPTSLLKNAHVPALLITNVTNIFYLTGVQVSMGYVLIKNRSLTLYVDPRYIEAAKKYAYSTVTVIPLISLDTTIAKLPILGIEAEHVSVASFQMMKKRWKNTKLQKTIGIVEGYRRSKDTKELKSFKKAQSITRQLMKRIPAMLKPGITEKQIGLQLLTIAIELGADEFAFEPIVAFGTHTSSPHHHMTSRKLKKGDIVQIDCGVKYKGYCADQSRVFFTGPRTAKQHEVYLALLEAKKAATDAIEVGVSCDKPDNAARDILKKYNLEQYFTHSLGHGVGLEVHEGISFSYRAKSKILQKNEIVTIEPGVYIPGKFGMRIEDEIIVT